MHGIGGLIGRRLVIAIVGGACCLGIALSAAYQTPAPRLPQVLLIGDSITLEYSEPVRSALEGVAEVSVIPENARDTARSVPLIERWLGETRWDVIHFNWGLHDLKHPVKRGDAEQVSLADYQANLSRLVEALNRTEARLIFATTTPVAPGARPERRPEDIPDYNQAAAAVMHEHQVVIDDLYSVALDIERFRHPDGVHYQPEGRRILGEAVARSIFRQLAHPR
jgi:acyl-CoA thioesterase-1